MRCLSTQPREPPTKDHGLATAAKNRRRAAALSPAIEAFDREYSDRPIAKQLLSDLLWAAFGINRPSGDRTAPYWRHVMVIDPSICHG